MRLFAWLTVVLFVGATRVRCQYTTPSTNATFVADEIAQISTCGLSCLEITIPAAGCSILNTTCQCESTVLVASTSSCMLANCTLAETLELSKIQAAICGRPYESRNPEIRIMTIVCTIISNTAVVLRLAMRYFLGQSMGGDDWTILAAVITDAVFVYYGIQIERNGFGDHVWNINLAVIPNLFYWFYVLELLYVLTIGLVKISILLFYLRIFPVRSLRIASWAMISYCVATTVVFALVTAFQCKPIEYVWNKDLPGGTCVNYNAVAWANAAINIQQDILIIVLPINALRRLQLCLKKKIGMYAMFGVGSFVCITSMVRLDSLRTFGLTADPTWDNIPTTFWSTLETTTAIFCACMPAIRAGLVRLFPRVMSTIPRTFRSTAGAHPSMGSAYGLSSNITTNTRPLPSGSAQEVAAKETSPSPTLSITENKIADKSDWETVEIASRASLTTVDEEGLNSESEAGNSRLSVSLNNSSRIALAANAVEQTPQRPTVISIYNPNRNLGQRATDKAKPLPPLPLTPGSFR